MEGSWADLFRKLPAVIDLGKFGTFTRRPPPEDGDINQADGSAPLPLHRPGHNNPLASSRGDFLHPARGPAFERYSDDPNANVDPFGYTVVPEEYERVRSTTTMRLGNFSWTVQDRERVRPQPCNAKFAIIFTTFFLSLFAYFAWAAWNHSPESET